MGAFWWVAMILLFFLGESAIVTWGNVSRERRRELPPGRN